MGQKRFTVESARQTVLAKLKKADQLGNFRVMSVILSAVSRQFRDLYDMYKELEVTEKRELLQTVFNEVEKGLRDNISDPQQHSEICK